MVHRHRRKPDQLQMQTVYVDRQPQLCAEVRYVGRKVYIWFTKRSASISEADLVVSRSRVS